MANEKLNRALQKAASEGGKLYADALAALNRKDHRITELVRVRRNLERQLSAKGEDGISLADYDRKDLENAIADAGDNPRHLRIVLDSIFGAA